MSAEEIERGPVLKKKKTNALFQITPVYIVRLAEDSINPAKAFVKTRRLPSSPDTRLVRLDSEIEMQSMEDSTSSLNAPLLYS
jgi:hypothetical protein